MQKARFTLEDFRIQMRRVKQMGSLESILKMIPGMGALGDKLAQVSPPEKELERTEAIINSMTMQERNTPDILNGSRRSRIAKGSGTTVQDVNKLLRGFEQMRQMMKGMMGGKVPGGGRMPHGMPGMGMPGMGGLPGMGMPGGGGGSSATKKRKKREQRKRKKKK
jgi:signal recognition particle subunit SRP54